MKNNINISAHKDKILIFFLFLFSLLINQYYGNKGIFPLDSFAYFDTGFRILLGEYYGFYVTFSPGFHQAFVDPQRFPQ